MMSGKAQASQQPTALGSMLQASTYGMTIPVGYGCTLTPLLVTWAANLRQGGSGKKGKGGKKGVPTYCENITFLTGKNPILTLLQAWQNGGKFPLNFLTYSTTGSGATSITIPDAEFYAVTGVTVVETYSAIFNDWGSTPNTANKEAQTIPASGPYTVAVTNAAAFIADLGVINAGTSAPFTKVTGAPTASGEYGVSAGVYTFYSADASTAVKISYTYGTSVSGSYEVPMWNELVSGPDPVANSAYRNWPYCYRWQPGYGAEIFMDAPTPFSGKTIKIYYAQLNSATIPDTPISKLRMHFEQTLGDGDEYDGFTSQQIKYPWYAGCGSQTMDLGAAGTIPQINCEQMMKFALYSRGDADFVDMIEDLVKSGITQAALGAV